MFTRGYIPVQQNYTCWIRAAAGFHEISMGIPTQQPSNPAELGGPSDVHVAGWCNHVQP